MPQHLEIMSEPIYEFGQNKNPLEVFKTIVNSLLPEQRLICGTIRESFKTHGPYIFVANGNDRMVLSRSLSASIRQAMTGLDATEHGRETQSVIAKAHKIEVPRLLRQILPVFYLHAGFNKESWDEYFQVLNSALQLAYTTEYSGFSVSNMSVPAVMLAEPWIITLTLLELTA